MGENADSLNVRRTEREYYEKQARDGYRDGVLSAFEDVLHALSLELPATVYADVWSRWGDVRDTCADYGHHGRERCVVCGARR